jgi:2'-5' RNA ligase
LVRSFIAVDINDPALLDRFVNIQRQLEETGADLKLVERRNIHITIRFLGELGTDMVQEVEKAMRSISFEPFEVEFRGLGAFPSLGRINVIWVGIREGADRLSEIFAELEPKIIELGLPADQRGFSPHMTIARVRTGRNRGALANMVRRLQDEEFGAITVHSLELKKSVLTPDGPIYSTLSQVFARP